MDALGNSTMPNKTTTARKCRGYLEIEQGGEVTRYALRPIISQMSHVRAYQLRKLEGKPEGMVYVVTQDISGARECDCGAAVFRDGPCKHIRSCAALGLFLSTRELLALQTMQNQDDRTGRKGDRA